MDKDAILEALEAGEFDGISHEYQSYTHGGVETWVTMEVSGSTIIVEKHSEGKFFDGRENEPWSKCTTEHLTGSDALGFIEKRPYFFAQRRPDLF